MRQRRWLEKISNYHCKIKYHPSKASVVGDALSHKMQAENSSICAPEMDFLVYNMGRLLIGNLQQHEKITNWEPSTRYNHCCNARNHALRLEGGKSASVR